MATFHALFSDGLRATFKADTMVIEEGVIVLMGGQGGGPTALAALGADELLFIYEDSMAVEIDESDDEEEDEEGD